MKFIPHSVPALSPVESNAVKAVVSSGFIGYGVYAVELERRISRQTRKPYGFAVSSGLHALLLALRSLDLRHGSRIGIPILTCGSVVAAVRTAGHVPVLLDILPDLTLSPLAVSRARAHLDAFVAPHAYGSPLDALALANIGLPWVEDCATSPTTTAFDEHAGSFGTCAIFSLGSTKFFTGGSGGVLVVGDALIAQKIEDLLDADQAAPKAFWNHSYPPPCPGRLNDICAALALKQWDRLPSFTEYRQKIASLYDARFIHSNLLLLPPRPCGHSFHRYIVRTTHPSAFLANRLREAGIDARSSINPWLENHVGVDCSQGPWPVSASWRHHLLSLPIHLQVTESDADFISTTLLNLLNELQS